MSIDLVWTGEHKGHLWVRGTCVNRERGIYLGWADEDRSVSTREILSWLVVMKRFPDFEFEWILCASAFRIIDLDFTMSVSSNRLGEFKGTICTSDDIPIGTAPALGPKELDSMLHKPIVWDGENRIGAFQDVQFDAWSSSTRPLGPELFEHRLGPRLQVGFTIYKPIMFPWLFPYLGAEARGLPHGMVDLMARGKEKRDEGVGFEVDL